MTSAYLSHAIRGSKGASATDADMLRNCLVAKKAAKWIRESISYLDLYVPAEHEDFVHIAYREKYLTEKQILDIDCGIVDQKDFLIVLVENGWKGGGIAVEIKYAKDNNIPIFYIEKMDVRTAMLLRLFVANLAKGKENDNNPNLQLH